MSESDSKQPEPSPGKSRAEINAPKFPDRFAIEINAWLYGQGTYPGEDFPALIQRVGLELGITFRAAVRFNLVYDVPGIARRFAVASSFVLAEEEIAAAICGQLPHPFAPAEDRRKTLCEILRRAYPRGRIAERVAESWAEAEARAAGAEIQAAKDRAEMDALPDLPPRRTP